MKQKRSVAWLNLGLVVLLVLSFAGLRMCVHKVGQGAKVTSTDDDVVTVDTIVNETLAKKDKKTKSKTKTQKRASGPIERSFLDEPVPEPD